MFARDNEPPAALELCARLLTNTQRWLVPHGDTQARWLALAKRCYAEHARVPPALLVACWRGVTPDAAACRTLLLALADAVTVAAAAHIVVFLTARRHSATPAPPSRDRASRVSPPFISSACQSWSRAAPTNCQRCCQS